MPLDDQVAALAARYRPLAARILREAIRIPADHIDKPGWRRAATPCAGSATTRARGSRCPEADRRRGGRGAPPEDAAFDAYGNLVWVVQDEADGIPARDKRVIYLDGHADTVNALRPQWREKTSGGIDSYDGLVDLARVDRSVLRGCSAPPDGEWERLLFGRGSADHRRGHVADRGHEDPARACGRGDAPRRHRALLRHRRRGGQRRRGAAPPDGPRPARSGPGSRTPTS